MKLCFAGICSGTVSDVSVTGIVKWQEKQFNKVHLSVN